MPEKLKGQPTLREAVQKTVEEIATKAYQEVAEARDMPIEEVYHSGVCEQVSEVVQRHLSGVYGDAAHVLRFEQPGFALHQFVRLTIGNESLIIDPTWQQFLDAPDPSKPTVLCVEAETVGQQLSSLGIPSAIHHFWLDAVQHDT